MTTANVTERIDELVRAVQTETWEAAAVCIADYRDELKGASFWTLALLDAIHTDFRLRAEHSRSIDLNTAAIAKEPAA